MDDLRSPHGLLIAALLVLSLPIASGTHGGGATLFFEAGQQGSTTQYELLRAVDSDTSPSPGEVVNETFLNEPRHTFLVVNQTIFVVFIETINYQQNANGVWRLQAFLDGQPIVGCTWAIRTMDPGLFGGDPSLTSHFRVECTLPIPLASGSHTLTLERNVESGSPATIDNSVTSTIVRRQDIVLLDEETHFEALLGLTALEFTFVMALLVTGVVLWAKSKDLGIRLLGITVVVIDFAITLGLTAQGRGKIWLGVSLALICLALFSYMTISLFLEHRKKEPGG